jgi:hypothetical protein
MTGEILDLVGQGDEGAGITEMKIGSVAIVWLLILLTAAAIDVFLRLCRYAPNVHPLARASASASSASVRSNPFLRHPGKCHVAHSSQVALPDHRYACQFQCSLNAIVGLCDKPSALTSAQASESKTILTPADRYGNPRGYGQAVEEGRNRRSV